MANGSSEVVTVTLMLIGAARITDSISRAVLCGGETTCTGQMVLLSQCESWGTEALRRLTPVAIPKDMMEVSILGDEGTSSISVGYSVISLDESSEVWMT